MIKENSKPEIYDGKDEVIFSEIFNLHNNEILIKKVLGHSFHFIFKKRSEKKEDSKGGEISISVNEKEKIITITIGGGFRGTLGASTNEKMPLFSYENKQVLVSFHGQAAPKSDFLNITITFYLREK